MLGFHILLQPQQGWKSSSASARMEKLLLLLLLAPGKLLARRMPSPRSGSVPGSKGWMDFHSGI